MFKKDFVLRKFRTGEPPYELKVRHVFKRLGCRSVASDRMKGLGYIMAARQDVGRVEVGVDFDPTLVAQVIGEDSGLLEHDLPLTKLDHP